MLAATAALPLGRFPVSIAAEPQPYGTDPRLLETYHPGELWPLTFTQAQRRQATVLCDVIIPADARSPSASAVGVVDFIDEWISAPYPTQREDRETVLAGLTWFEAEASSRFSKPMSVLAPEQLRAICEDIRYLPQAKPDYLEAARFFARYRALTAGGFYTTPHGREDLGYVGNVPLARFDGPPLEVLQKAGLA
jgi:hypothetical protein